MKNVMVLAAMTIMVALSANALAHGEKPKHGGIVVEAKDGTNVELVGKDGKATLYLDDHDGKPVATKGASGKLTVLNGGDKTEVALEAAGDNSLVSKGDVKLAKGAKAIATITLGDKKTVNARFAVK